MSDGIKTSNQLEKIEEKEVERTVEYWKKIYNRGIDKHILTMVIYEHGLEERDRLTKSRLESLMNLRKNKRIG